MRDKLRNADEVEDLERRLAFAEACGDTLDFGSLLSRIGGLFFKWVQCDVAAVILPGVPDAPPVVHTVGRRPLQYFAELSMRDECARLLAELDFAYVSGDDLGHCDGPDLMPLHGDARDGPIYRLWSQPLEYEGECMGILVMFGYVDWILAPRLRRLLRSFATMTARAIRTASTVEVLRNVSTHDVLTGTFNQQGLEQNLRRECARATRDGGPLSLLVFDLDRFDRINESHGRSEGDAVLCQVAQTIRGEIRGSDVVARNEGEFLVILPDIPVEEAERIGERIAQAVQEIGVGGHDLTISVGVAGVDTRASDPVEHLLARGSEALEVSKRNRRRISLTAI